MGGGSCGHDHGDGEGHDHDHDHGHSHEDGKPCSGHDHEGGGHSHADGKPCSGHDHGDHAKEKAHEPKKDTRRNINVDAAFLHALGDMIMSIGVCTAATIIFF